MELKALQVVKELLVRKAQPALKAFKESMELKAQTAHRVPLAHKV
jgi:hypothetical protein